MDFDYSKVDLAVSKLIDGLSPKAIILFGSAADGTTDADSAIDIMVIMDTDLDYTERNIEARLIVGHIGMPVDVIVHTPDEIEEERDNRYSLIHEVMKTGKVLYGAV
jgi:predicted nucleotidyltransferase